MPDLCITSEGLFGDLSHHSGAFKKDVAQWAVLGLQGLETCSPRLRHMEEIEAT
jgi:hypothetical protein